MIYTIGVNIRQLYLDNIRNNLILPSRATILIATDKTLVADIKELFPKASVSVGSPAEQRANFDCVIDLNATSAPDIDHLTTALKTTGLLVLGGQNIRQSATFSLSRRTDKYLFRRFRLQPLFREPIGKPSNTLGRYLPVSKWYSPYALFIYERTTEGRLRNYQSHTTLFARIRRVRERAIYTLRNHKINDYLHDVRIFLESITPFGYRLFYRDKVPHHLFPASTNRIRLAIVTGQLAAGGVERVLLQIIDTLPKDEFDICIFSTDFNSNAWKRNFERRAKVVDIPWVLSRSKLQRYIKPFLIDSIVGNSFDVVFMTNSTAGYKSLPAIHKKYTKLDRKLEVFDLLHTHGTPLEKDAFLRISQPFDKYITKRIVITQYLKDYFCRHYPVDPNKVIIIHNGISRTSEVDAANLSLGQQFLKLQPGERAITYLGRLQADKSPERLVHLAATLRDELTASSSFIAVVGEGNLRPSLENEARRLGILDKQIRFLGYSDHALSIAAASWCTILTSNLEGLPMSALESMSVGTPVIAPAVGGLPEIIDNEINGLLATFTDNMDDDAKVASLATQLKFALSLTEEEHGLIASAAKQKVRTQFVDTEQQYAILFKAATRQG